MKYAIELRRYKVSKVENEFSLKDEQIKKLLKLKILKKDSYGNMFFNFVGIIEAGNTLICVFPKYIKEINFDKHKVFKDILNLFFEYSNRENLDKEELEGLGDLETSEYFNKLAIAINLVNEYMKNGIYCSEKNEIILNGVSDINWNETIENINPIIKNSKPIYVDIYTDEIVNDIENYIRTLHIHLLSKCLEWLNDIGILEYIGGDKLVFEYDKDLIKELEYNENIILNELNIQFIDYKKKALNIMLSYLRCESMRSEENIINFYGTRSFHVVWEKVLGFVLNNKFDKFKHMIDKPKWVSESKSIYEANTLIPDIISIYNDEFLIFDAKYYNIELDDSNFKNNPGIEDVTKQYLYQLAFDKYIKLENKKVRNILLFPNEEDDFKKIGHLELKFLKDIGLEDIELMKISTEKVFKLYTEYKRLNISEITHQK